MTINYELVVQRPTTHFFPSKELQHLKRYLCWGLFNKQGPKISNFVCCMDKVVKYLKHFTMFGKPQGILEEKNHRSHSRVRN